MPLRATDIHICSNYLPEQWWGEKTRYDQGAIYRRITEVHWHDKYKHYFKFVSSVPGQLEGCAMDKFMVEYRKANPIFVAPAHYN